MRVAVELPCRVGVTQHGCGGGPGGSGGQGLGQRWKLQRACTAELRALIGDTAVEVPIKWWMCVLQHMNI